MSSGTSYPLLPMKRRRGPQKSEQNTNGGVANSSSSGTETETLTYNDSGLQFSHDCELTPGEVSDLSNRIFTVSELEGYIFEMKQKMVEIQGQIYRGEEIYYESTYSHGSLFKGFDGFESCPTKDVTAPSDGPSFIQTRRVPADCRWFSASCKSVPRSAHSSQFTTNVSKKRTKSEWSPTVPTSTSAYNALHTKVEAVDSSNLYDVNNVTMDKHSINNLSPGQLSSTIDNEREKIKSLSDIDERISKKATQERNMGTVLTDGQTVLHNQQILGTVSKAEIIKLADTTPYNDKVITNATNLSYTDGIKEQKSVVSSVPRKRGRPKRKN